MNIRSEEECGFIRCDKVAKFGVNDLVCTVYKPHSERSLICYKNCMRYERIRNKQPFGKCYYANKLLGDDSRLCTKFKVGEAFDTTVCKNCEILKTITATQKQKLVICSVVIDDWYTWSIDCKKQCLHAAPHSFEVSCYTFHEECKQCNCIPYSREIYNKILEEMKWNAEYEFGRSEFGKVVGVFNNDEDNLMESKSERNNREL